MFLQKETCRNRKARIHIAIFKVILLSQSDTMKNTSCCHLLSGDSRRCGFCPQRICTDCKLEKKIYLEYFLKSNLSTIHMKTHEQIPGMKLQSLSTLPPRLCTSLLLQRKHTVGNCCETRKKKAILHA